MARKSFSSIFVAATLFVAQLMGAVEARKPKALGVCSLNHRHLSVVKIRANEGTNVLKKAWNRLRGRKHIDSRMPHVEFVLAEGEALFTSYFSRGEQKHLESGKSGDMITLTGGPAKLPTQDMKCRIRKRGDRRNVVRKLGASIGAIGYLDDGQWRFLQPDYSKGDTVSVGYLNVRSEETVGTVYFRRGEPSVHMDEDKTVIADSTDNTQHKLAFVHSEAAKRFYDAIHSVTENDVFGNTVSRSQVGGDGSAVSTDDRDALEPSDFEVDNSQ
ncbi:hypothetical protein FOL47_010107 [Perkinsus chesapeaki]|uniref:Uncharacterized protein n=1 Tax=Perkinsus chesapeaki TaxID=330153 RepID=A0A7J6L4M7_PERCH|nr:hypothetical protein FOL47_010107 [Perkinsus chesapeaki]